MGNRKKVLDQLTLKLKSKQSENDKLQNEVTYLHTVSPLSSLGLMMIVVYWYIVNFIY